VSGGPVPDSARAPRPADTGPPTTLVLVRHGRTAFTEQGRLSGRGGVDPQLSPAGRSDAAGVAALIAGLAEPAQVVVCSPLARTRQTAAAIAAATGLGVQVRADWVEIGFGDWDGLTPAELAERWPDQLRAWQGSSTVAPPGGESLDELVARIRVARAALVAEHPGRVVVVVTHATPVRVAVAEAMDAGPAALWRTRIDPASVTVLRFWSDDGAEVVTVNTTAHLTPAAVPSP